MTEVQARELGRLVKQARRVRQLSLRALDELTGVSYGWLSRLERGQMIAPAPSKLTKVAEALGIAPERIDRITRGGISRDLPPIRTYFRAKYQLTPREITQIEEVFDQIRRSRHDHPDGEIHT
ncbi:MAG TPA: helix-turn-helix transcriptional regulator [Solirubrobacteraceae bacterium]|jgi:transcriptional regulator with XRE-family HTH domain|nr:helix-turn-helix transcriptional regulator [Solirubrobacteraceae bacterium]